jgi:DNA repair protein RadC
MQPDFGDFFSAKERVRDLGIDALADAELLALLLGGGNGDAGAHAMAQSVLDEFGGARGLARAGIGEIAERSGLGPSGIGSKAAKRDHFKTGQRAFVSETGSFLSFGDGD